MRVAIRPFLSDIVESKQVSEVNSTKQEEQCQLFLSVNFW